MYVEKRSNIVVKNIKKVSHPEAQFSSYKVSVEKDHLASLLDETFWPRGVVCEVWRQRATHKENANQLKNMNDISNNETV